MEISQARFWELVPGHVVGSLSLQVIFPAGTLFCSYGPVWTSEGIEPVFLKRKYICPLSEINSLQIPFSVSPQINIPSFQDIINISLGQRSQNMYLRHVAFINITASIS